MQLLSATNISKSYYGHAVLNDISFAVNDGDRIALIGSNGAGKTTLFKIIEGTTPPDLGTINVSKNTIIGFLAQNVDEQDFGDNVLISRELLEAEKNVTRLEKGIASSSDSPSPSLLSEYAAAVARFEALGGYDFEHRMKEALAGLGLRDFDFTRSISSMSGGEKMRVGLARLIVQKPDLLLLDEPTNHLDAAAMEWLERFLAKYKGAVLLISHDRYFIDKTASLIFELENGTIRTYPGNYTAFCQQKKQNLDNQKRLIDGLEGELSRQQEVTQTMLSHRKMSSYHAREKVVAKLSDRLEAK
jgi:ATP-binding cassette subfamily F protein 3